MKTIAELILRPYESADCEKMAALFYDTVHKVNARDYSPAQLDAWATGQVDLAQWDRSFREHYSLVALRGGELVGFGDMALEEGYLDRLYVQADCQGQGIATTLCDQLEAAVSGPIEVHASLTARPFFEGRGYRVLREQQVECRGVWMPNFVMVKER